MTKLVVRGTVVVSALVMSSALALAQVKKEVAPPPEKAAPAMEMPKPSAEVAQAAKAMAGTWKCTGDVPDSPMGKGHKVTGTMKWKLDLDKMWLVGTYTGNKSKDDPMPYKFYEYRIYDAKGAKWYSTSVDNMGGWGHASSSASGNKVVWEGAGSMVGMPGEMKSRSTEERVNPKQVGMTAEMSMDGKTWVPAFTGTCKK